MFILLILWGGLSSYYVGRSYPVPGTVLIIVYIAWRGSIKK